MKPRETNYRLMVQSDRPMLKKIWADNKKLFGEPKKLGWPTVVAERQSRILGFITTDTTAKLIVAGPLIVNGGSSSFTVLRLIQAYENVLKYAGMDGYFFHIEKKNKHWLKMVRTVGVPEVDKTSKGFWFKRELRRNGQQST